MSKVMHTNGLRPIKLAYDTATHSHDLKSFKMKDILDKTPMYAVFYFAFGIRFGLWDGSTFHFANDLSVDHNLKYLQLARLFNKDKEIKCWVENDQLKSRILVDKEEKSSENDFNVVQAEQILWGTDVEGESISAGTFKLNGKEQEYFWHTLIEDRGTELTVPLPISELKLDPQKYPKKRIAIQTYNYIGYLDNGLATYVDSRFVDIVVPNNSSEINGGNRHA